MTQFTDMQRTNCQVAVAVSWYEVDSIASLATV